jgi:hypothetical protein
VYFSRIRIASLMGVIRFSTPEDLATAAPLKSRYAPAKPSGNDDSETLHNASGVFEAK